MSQIARFEKFAKPDEAIYVEFGKDVPIKVLNGLPDCTCCEQVQKVKWKDNDASCLKNRTTFLKQLVMSVFAKQTKEEAAAAIDGLFDFMLAAPSMFENAFCLMLLVGSHARTRIGATSEKQVLPNAVKEILVGLVAECAKFNDWRIARGKLEWNPIGSRTSYAAGVSTVRIFADLDHNLCEMLCVEPDNFTCYLLNDEEYRQLMNLVKAPTHWLHEHFAAVS